MSGVRSQQADLLREAEEKLRASVGAEREAVEAQAAILNALPAHIALIDEAGVILTANESWCSVANASALLGVDAGVGENYLDICERSDGPCSDEAHTAAAGIRRVLRGEAKDYALEYACHSRDGAPMVPAHGHFPARRPTVGRRRHARQRHRTQAGRERPAREQREVPSARGQHHGRLLDPFTGHERGALHQSGLRADLGTFRGKRGGESATMGRLHRARRSRARAAPFRRAQAGHSEHRHRVSHRAARWRYPLDSGARLSSQECCR